MYTFYNLYIHTFIHLCVFIRFASISYCSIHSYESFQYIIFNLKRAVSFPYLGSGLDSGSKTGIDINSNV